MMTYSDSARGGLKVGGPTPWWATHYLHPWRP